MTTTKQLRAAAEEMIEVMDLRDDNDNLLSIDKKTNEQDLIAFIKKAADMIEDDDFSEETQEIIDNVIIGDSEPKKETGKKSAKKQPEPEPEPEEYTLIEEIEDADSLKALIFIAKTNDEFKILAKKLITYKKVDVLRNDMLAILKTEPEEPKFEEEPESEKPKAPGKTSSKSTKRKPELEPKPKAKKETEKKDTDVPKKPRGFQKQVGKKRSTIFAECMNKAIKKPILIESIVDAMSEEYQGSIKVSKFYIKTMIDYLGELDIIEVSSAGILFKK